MVVISRRSIYSLLSDLGVRIFILAYTWLIAGVLILNHGLPSYIKGVFQQATIAFQIAEAKMIDYYGSIYVPSWYGLFDTIRFYPPVGLTLVYSVGKAVGSFEYAAMICYFIALFLLLNGFYTFTYTVSKSRAASLLAVILLSLVHGYFSTIAIYWEYTRILGEGIMFYALSELYKLLQHGHRRNSIKAGFLAGLTLLTHLIAFIEYIVIALVMLIVSISQHWKMGLDEQGFKYFIKLVRTSFYVFLATTLWWVIPAIVPFGIEHYFLIKTPVSFKLQVLAEGLTVHPNLYSPTTQLPLIILGLVVIPYLIYKRKLITTLSIVSLLAVSLAYGQGTRIIPLIGALIVVGIAETLGLWRYVRKNKAYFIALAAIVLAFIAFYFQHYYKLYNYYLEPDSTYMYSDEYKTALWLWTNSKEQYRVYVMYGPTYRGSQWVNVFAPGLKQVLGGFNEGCINREYLQFDYLFKNTRNIVAVENLIEKLSIKYIVVDEPWAKSFKPNIVDELLLDNYIKPISGINDILVYSKVFEVVNAKSFNMEEHRTVFFTPIRILAIILTIIPILKLSREYPTL